MSEQDQFITLKVYYNEIQCITSNKQQRNDNAKLSAGHVLTAVTIQNSYTDVHPSFSKQNTTGLNITKQTEKTT